MKCEIIRSDVEASLAQVPAELHDQIEFRTVRRNWRDVKVPFWRNGAILEHRQAYLLVGLGLAKPADEECEVAAARWTGPNWAATLQAADEARNGIHPKDRPAYRAGWMRGYRATTDDPVKDLLGNESNLWEPGEKWGEYQALLEKAATDEDEDEDE